MLKDKVFIDKLSATAIIGKDSWGRPSPQPIDITVSMETDFLKASLSDNLKHSLNYAVISRNVMDHIRANEHRNFKSLKSVTEEITEVVLDEKKGGGAQAEVTVASNKSEIRAKTVFYKIDTDRRNDSKPVHTLQVEKLSLLTIIGVFTFERVQKQIVEIDLSMKLSPQSDVLIHKIIDEVTTYVEQSNFKTLEALVLKIGQLVLEKDESIEEIFVKCSKPNAIMFADKVGVSSVMKRDSFEGLAHVEVIKNNDISFNMPSEHTSSNNEEYGNHTAYIAFGSNQGDQVGNIDRVIDLMQNFGIQVEATSSLYVSKPMYYKDQPDFYNGALKVTFSQKSPFQLLKDLKTIEYEYCDRKKLFDNGPRTIDLDIILFDELSVNTEELTIPHKSMLERTFVLQPLCELLPPDFLHPISAEPIHNHLNQLLSSNPDNTLQDSSDLWQIVPIPRLKGSGTDNKYVLRFDHLKNQHKTVIMGILNMTPDSFSDKGKHYNLPLDSILQYSEQLIKDGADIIDIGGVSTRPGSSPPSEQEELDRVLPVVKAIRSSPNKDLADVILSIDTYRANVAEQCLLVGADIINDISMGLYDNKMFGVIAKYGCPYVMNHTRGTPDTMSMLTQYLPNNNDDIIEYTCNTKGLHTEVDLPPDVTNLIFGVSRELALQMNKAFAANIKKWQIILDPGIGFAKTLPQNLQLIRHASVLKKYAIQHNNGSRSPVSTSYTSFNGLPLLIGTSRKKFLGTITGEKNAEKRVTASTAAAAVSVSQHTDIVRVHDVSESARAIAVADAIYRDRY